MTRDDLQVGDIVCTLHRGERDLGIIIEKNGVKYAKFKNCEVQLQAHYNKNMTSKGFDGEHIMKVLKSRNVFELIRSNLNQAETVFIRYKANFDSDISEREELKKLSNQRFKK